MVLHYSDELLIINKIAKSQPQWKVWLINVAVSEISYKSIPTAHVASETTVLRHITNQQVTQSVSDNHHQIVITMSHVIYEFDNYYGSSLS